MFSVSEDVMLRIGDFSRLAQVSIKTLRYYDETGLLKPVSVDRFTGYRYYMPDQLPRLNRIVVLKDLGLSLEQIAQILNDTPSADDMRRLLSIKRAELHQQIEEAQARLTRLDTRLRQIEMEGKMPDDEVILKRVDSQRVLSVRRIVPTVTDVRKLFDDTREAVHRHAIKPIGPWMALYHHAGYRDHVLDVELAVAIDTVVPEPVVNHNGLTMTVRVIPLIETAATLLLHGPYEGMSSAYTALSTYIHEHGHNYLGPAREIYLRGPDTTDEYLTEIQYPIGEFSSAGSIDGLELPAQWDASRQQHLPFSRRARMTLEWARMEAQQAAISPTHLLLGLLCDGDGFGGHVLSEFGMTVEEVRHRLPHGSGQVSEVPVSNAAQQIILFADAEARALGHDYIGTEHLLLGLVRQPDATMSDLLTSYEITPEQIRAAVQQAFRR